MSEDVHQHPDYVALKADHEHSQREIEELKRQLDWFKRQLFGEKSERRHADADARQLQLAELVGDVHVPPPRERETITYERGKARKQRADDCVTDKGLRFNDDVPVEVIDVSVPELEGPNAAQYERIDTKVVHRLAQRPASYVVLRYEIPVVKRRGSDQFLATSAPPAVLDRSLADVSLLAGLLVDKFQFHLPLYRQHQRLQQAGITLSRATLTNLVKASIELLRPIVVAQLEHVLQSKVLAIDETPIKAGRSGKGKMKRGWFWPVYGEDDEVVFTYAASRARREIEAILRESFHGTLLSDGYAAYASYVDKTAPLRHAQCWAHTRRKFYDARDIEPDRVDTALTYIGGIYGHEQTIGERDLVEENARAYRLEHSRPIVESFFTWCEARLSDADLLPDNPFVKAVNYTLGRRAELRVFLEDPEVQLDTNHLERSLRSIPMGRRNWLFCWTELGAEHVGIIQSLITTCRLHDVNPYDYLVDVLQRIGEHPGREVIDLTPRAWRTRFAADPLRSVLDSTD